VKSFWRWTGTVFFALAFVFLVLTGIGTSLPIDHQAACYASYEKPIPYLFAAVADDEASVSWRPGIANAVLVSGRGPTAVWRETDTHGGKITYRTIAYTEESKLTRSIDFVPGMPFGGTWTFLFSPGLEPTSVNRVMIVEDGQIYNPFFRFLARYIFGYTQSMESYLADLARFTHDKPDVICEANP
jgi:hypothetical protein